MTTIGISTAGAVPTTRTAWTRWVPLSGVVFAVVLGVALTITAGMPDAKNAAKAQAWDVKHTGLLNASWLLTGAAVIVGLYFLTWLHSRLAGTDGGWMGNLFLVGVVVFALAGCVGAGVEAVVGNDAKHLSTGSLQLMNSFNQNFNYSMTAIGLALMYLAAGFLIRRTGLLPGWLAWVSFLFAALSASIILAIIPLLGTALWLIAVSVILTARQPVAS